MWTYIGPTDSTRESELELTESEVDAQVRGVLDTRGLDRVGAQPAPLAANRPSTRVNFRSRLLFQPQPSPTMVVQSQGVSELRGLFRAPLGKLAF
jgi:hypothetical protein